MCWEGTNLLLLTISAFWTLSRWPLATQTSSRKQRNIPLGGRYRQVSLYTEDIQSCIQDVVNNSWELSIFGLTLDTFRKKKFASPHSAVKWRCMCDTTVMQYYSGHFQFMLRIIIVALMCKADWLVDTMWYHVAATNQSVLRTDFTMVTRETTWTCP